MRGPLRLPNGSPDAANRGTCVAREIAPVYEAHVPKLQDLSDSAAGTNSPTAWGYPRSAAAIGEEISTDTPLVPKWRTKLAGTTKKSYLSVFLMQRSAHAAERRAFVGLDLVFKG